MNERHTTELLRLLCSADGWWLDLHTDLICLNSIVVKTYKNSILFQALSSDGQAWFCVCLEDVLAACMIWYVLAILTLVSLYSNGRQCKCENSAFGRHICLPKYLKTDRSFINKRELSSFEDEWFLDRNFHFDRHPNNKNKKQQTKYTKNTIHQPSMHIILAILRQTRMDMWHILSRRWLSNPDWFNTCPHTNDNHPRIRRRPCGGCDQNTIRNKSNKLIIVSIVFVAILPMITIKKWQLDKGFCITTLGFSKHMCSARVRAVCWWDFMVVNGNDVWIDNTGLYGKTRSSLTLMWHHGYLYEYTYGGDRLFHNVCVKRGPHDASLGEFRAQNYCIINEYWWYFMRKSMATFSNHVFI